MKKLAIFLTLLLSLVIILIIFFRFTGKNIKSAKTIQSSVTGLRADSSNKSDFDKDLYYYKHPYLYKADTLNNQEKYDSAIFFYKEASNKFEKEHLWENYVWVNGYIARLYLYVNGMKQEEALPYLKKALEKGDQYLGDKHPVMAVTLYYAGYYYSNYEHQADKALQMYEKALEIYHKCYKEPNLYSSDVYEGMGNVYYNLKFDNLKAEENFLNSVKIKEALPSKVKDSVLTVSYYNLVQLYYTIGDIEKTQSYCLEALQYIPYVKGDSLFWINALGVVLATIYSEQQIYTIAIPRLRDWIQKNKKDKAGKDYLPFYYNTIGEIYKDQNKNDSAIIFFKEALSVIKTQSVSEDRDEQYAIANYSLGTVYLHLHQYSIALYYLKKCLDKRIQVFGSRNEKTALALQRIGNVYQDLNKFNSALKYYQHAIIACTKGFTGRNILDIPIFTNINNSIYLSNILKDKALLLKRLYKSYSDIKLLHASLAHYCLTDTLITDFQTRYSREVTKLSFINDKKTIYEEAIDCAALLFQQTGDKKYHDLVFRFMDKRKAGLLQEALTHKTIFREAGIVSDEQNKFLQLQQELAFLQSKLEDVKMEKGEVYEVILQKLHSRIKLAEAKIDSFNQRLIAKYPYYASIQSERDTVTLGDLKQFSSHTNSIILEYFWGDRAVYILGVLNNESVLFKVKDNELESHLDSLQVSLTSSYVPATKGKDFISFQKNSYYVYHTLVEPVLTAFEPGIRNKNPGITIVPDGSVVYIPFEALITKIISDKTVDYRQLNYLVKDFVISYDYSAKLLLDSYKHQDEYQDAKVLALSYSKDDTLRDKFSKLNQLKGYSLAELPGSVKEIKAISSLMSAAYYMGSDATEGVFKKEAPKYDIIHLAVHGQTDTAHSYRSRLVFKQGKDSLDDGYLYSYELYSLPLKAKLAVLSACESGKGKFFAGEGVYSMARAFTYAGCPATVMSLWQVNDNTTADIMRHFYEQLSGSSRVDESIRNAKLAYLKNVDHRLAHPSNWAGFIALGKMTAVVKKKNTAFPPFYLVILIGAGLIILIGCSLLFAKYKAKGGSHNLT